MRRIIEYCLVSADGIVLDDSFTFRNDQDDDSCPLDRRGLFEACGAILNAIRKCLFLSQLGTGEWDNPTIVGGDVVDGGDLLVQGHGFLGETWPKSLFREGQAVKLKLSATKSYSQISKLSYGLQ